MENKKLDYDIMKKYSHELNEIANKLEQLEHGRIYELTRVQMDGYLATNISQLKKMIAELLNKIQNGNEGTSEYLAKIMESISI